MKISNFSWLEVEKGAKETRAALDYGWVLPTPWAQGRGWFFTESSPDDWADAKHWPWQYWHEPDSVVTWHGAVLIFSVQGYHPSKQRRPYPSCLLGMSSLCQFPDSIKMLLARTGWPGLSCALLGTPEQFLKRTILIEWWGKSLTTTCFLAEQVPLWALGDLWGCLMLQRMGGSWMEALECPGCQWSVCLAHCWQCCPPCSSSTGEMTGVNVSLGTPTACFLSSSRQDVSCHGC